MTDRRSVASKVLGEHITFVRTAEETDGELLEMEAIYAANQSWETMLPHAHPLQEETFEVLEGTLTVELQGEQHIYKEGDRFVVPRGVAHAMRNFGAVPARMRWQVRPALQSQQFYEAALPAADRGALADPARIQALLQAFPDIFHLVAQPTLVDGE